MAVVKKRGLFGWLMASYDRASKQIGLMGFAREYSSALVYWALVKILAKL